MILKIHGAVDRVDAERDSYVITEDHYIDYLTRTDISNLMPGDAGRQAAPQPLPVPRLQPARLEPAGDPAPDLGRAGAAATSPGRSSSTPTRSSEEFWRKRGRRHPRRRRSSDYVAALTRTLADAAPSDGVRMTAGRRDRAATRPSHAVALQGPEPYTEEDAEFFFGRERRAARSSSPTCMASRLTLLYGASGVGKSSVLRAGVRPPRCATSRARRRTGCGDPSSSVVVRQRRGADDPIAGLRAAIAERSRAMLGRRAAAPTTVR